MRKFTTPEEWTHHLSAQRGSGKTVKSYCRGNDLDLSSFYRQRRKCSDPDTDAEPQAFVLARAFQPPKVSGSSLCIRVKDFTLTLEPWYRSDDLEGVLIILVKVQHEMKKDPFALGYYVFCSRSRKLLKVLYWDKSGFALWYKRLEVERFPWPKDRDSPSR